jgi:hypothetical protein
MHIEKPSQGGGGLLKLVRAFAHNNLDISIGDGILLAFNLLTIHQSPRFGSQIFNGDLRTTGEMLRMALWYLMNRDSDVLAGDCVVGYGKLSSWSESAVRPVLSPRVGLLTLCLCPTEKISLARPQPELAA